MDEQIPQVCPTCRSSGLNSRVQLYQINFEEAAVMCENTKCPFPFISPVPCPLVVSRNISELCLTPRPAKSLTDADSTASNSSGSSWNSRTSTTRSFSSTAQTPPPKFHVSSGAKVFPPANPRSVLSRVAESLGTNQIISAQSSPASSIASVTDKEVELFMRNSYAAPVISPNIQLTPSPSPEMSSTVSALFDDLEEILEQTSKDQNQTVLQQRDEAVSSYLSEIAGIPASRETETAQKKQSNSKSRPSVTETNPRITQRLTDTGTTQFVIQPSAISTTSKSTTQRKSATKSSRKALVANELNWVSEGGVTKAKTRRNAPVTKTRMGSVVQKFLSNFCQRPASI